MGLYADRKAAGKCVQCGYRDPESSKTKCGVCREKKRLKENSRRRNLAAVGICRCGQPAESGKKRCPACGVANNAAKKEWRDANPLYNTVAARQRFLEALSHYGGPVCKCCGEDNIFFLTLDHVNNDGAEHRRETGGKSGKNLAWWLKKHNYPSGFQVLCFNCNCGRARNGGVCPHHGETKWLS